MLFKFARQCLQNLERKIDQTPSDQLGKKFARHCLANPPMDEFYRHCLQNLLNAFSLISKSISALDGPITAFFLVKVIPSSVNFILNRLPPNAGPFANFERQIDGALFERVALSRDTRKLAAIEKKKGPQK